VTYRPQSSRQRVSAALAWRPEWPVGVLVVVAWVVLAALHVTTPAGSGGHHGAAQTLGVLVGGWALMSAAMMLPATLPAVRHVGLNSTRRRRWWAITVYVSAYVAVWIAFGVPALLLLGPVTATGMTDARIAAGLFAVAASWQLTRWKRRSVVACRRTVALPPHGRRADLACVRFGVGQAGRCVVASWPLMLLMALLGHTNLFAMIAATAVVAAEERTASAHLLLVPTAAAFAAGAVYAVVLV
jgi:predicted metal-binding membrane protein